MLHSTAEIIPVNLHSIPVQLRDSARWVLWKPLLHDDNSDVLTKSPFDCRFTGDRASCTRPETWSDFATAAAAYGSRETNGAGGLMVALGEGLAGIDLDNAIDPATGLAKPHAQQIIDRLNSYTELSVSGTGVRIFVRAPEAPGKKCGHVEIYSKARFMTVTGRHISGTPETVEERSTELAALRDELQQMSQATRPVDAGTVADITRLRKMVPGVTTLGVPDSEIIMRASEVCGERFDALWAGDTSAYDDDESRADLALAGVLAFMCGPGEEERVEKLMRQSKLIRPKWGRGDYLPQLTIPRAYSGRQEFYRWDLLSGFAWRQASGVTTPVTGGGAHAAVVPEPATGPTSAAIRANGASGSPGHHIGRERPTIVLGVETDAILKELEFHLAPTIFQRVRQLVQVVETNEGGSDGVCRRQAGAPMITAVSVEQVQRLMSRHVRFVDSTPGNDEEVALDGGESAACGSGRAGKKRKRRKMVQKSAPKHLAQLLTKCGRWTNIPVLNGLMSCLFMRPDGMIVNKPGYDPMSSYLLLDRGMPRVVVPDVPTAEDVAQAVTLIQDLVSDFPFADRQHFSAWLAALLTAVARPAIEGPVPMLWVDANRRGTGKSKLGRLIGIITAGSKPTELSWTSDEQEMESRIASLLNAGDNFAVFDNASGTIRNPILERFLTCHAFDFRRYFSQELVKMPNRTVLAITGNNLTLRGDLSRRVIRCRLVTAMECPETRDGFRHANIEAYAEANQAELLAAALTILRAHAVAGFASCPIRSIQADGSVIENPARPVGSFNDWDRVVRHAILRAGLADPMVTQDEAREEDEDDVKLRALLEAWHHLAWHHHARPMPWSVNELLANTFDPDEKFKPKSGAESVAAAILEITDTAPGRMPEPRTLGFRLRDARDKWIGGYCLRRSKRSNMGVRYIVECDHYSCLECRRRRGNA